jgi:hypothetical protein
VVNSTPKPCPYPLNFFEVVYISFLDFTTQPLRPKFEGKFTMKEDMKNRNRNMETIQGTQWNYIKTNNCPREIVAGRRTRRETHRLSSDNEAGGRDGKAER